MKKNYAILISILLVFSVSYLIYIIGEITLEKARGSFDIIAFNDTGNACDKSSLSFYLENNSSKNKRYLLEIMKNNELLKTINIEIDSKEHKPISLEAKDIENICRTKETFKYKIVNKTKQNKQTIYKIINQ